MIPIDPRAVIIANNAGRIVAAMESRGLASNEESILSAVHTAHEILYQAEQAAARPTPYKQAA